MRSTQFRPGLFKAVRPKFEEQLYARVIRQNTTRSAQSVKLISLDIHFDEIHSFARLEVVVERYHFDRHCMSANLLRADTRDDRR